ncbi:guanylate kinase [Buchnera aphidicola (Ceratoglyphina bambusae)]|uniref:guanylate kinase n=1 Tax=Buchnera aphidicola TaxID=9 RepID=UPI0031B8948D
MKKSKNIIGTCFIFSGPSGVGKTSLLKSFLKKKILKNIFLSVSYTTRTMRSNETNKIHYNFVTKKVFKRMIQNNKFLEYAQIFDNYYGTGLNIVKQKLLEGNDIFFNVDINGANEIKRKILFSKSIFILPPSKNEIINRLKKRSKDSNIIIKNRMKKFVTEVKNYKYYDYLIINDSFEKTLKNIKIIIQSEKLKTIYSEKKYFDLINNLIL